MYLSAISVGDAVPRVGFDAVVHSVFQTAINLRPMGKSNLLTLVTSSEADLPQGIRVNTPDNFSFEKFQVGEGVTCRDKCLRFDSLTIELEGAPRWKCDLSKLEIDSTDPAIPAAWDVAWSALNKRQRLLKSEIIADELFSSNGPTPGSVSHKAGEALHELIDVTQHHELTNTSAVKALIGLGAGLTPSGDDLLIGYMTGLWSTIHNRNERIQFISQLGKTIVRLSHRTNDISRTYLYHAARGQVSSRLSDLATAISRGENPKRLVESAMNVGHTSGVDAVTGLLIGLTAWDSSKVFHC